MKTKIYSLIAAALMMGAASCETISVNEFLDSAPVVENFYPAEGYAGCKITVKGEGLHNVVGAKIGDVDAVIAERLSDSELSILVPAMAKSGKISLVNAKGQGVSAAEFSVTYPAPAPDMAQIPAETELSANMLIYGQRMGVITNVLFQADGYAPHAAEKVSQTDREIVIKVPYVENDNAKIKFEYYDGSALVLAGDAAVAPVRVARFQPAVSAVSATSAAVGDVVSLSGKYMDKVEKVLLNGGECMISSQTADAVSFVVPDLESFEDGDNAVKIEIVYFSGIERSTVSENFKVKVPAVLFWQDRKIWGQGRDVEEFTSFFSPQTGICYANAMWRTLDAVSYAKQAGTCSAAQVPTVSEDEYNSVLPYFFLAGVSQGQLQINSPAASKSMLRNIYTENNSAADYRVTGNSGDCWGTPVMAFLPLSEANELHAALINKVKNGTLDRLDASTYPVDEAAMTVGGISVSSAANAVKDTQYAPGVFTVGENKSVDVDLYVMVLYYNYKGQNTANKAENLRRMGVMRIRHIDFKLYNNTNAPSSSSMVFDMYWMKRDYK